MNFYDLDQNSLVSDSFGNIVTVARMMEWAFAYVHFCSDEEKKLSDERFKVAMITKPL